MHTMSHQMHWNGTAVVKLNLDRMLVWTRKYQDFIKQKTQRQQLGITSKSDNKISSQQRLARCASLPRKKSLVIIHLHNPALHLNVFIPFFALWCHYCNVERISIIKVMKLMFVVKSIIIFVTSSPQSVALMVWGGREFVFAEFSSF